MVAVMLLPFFLLFVGDAQIPLGASAATVPLGVLLLTPLLALRTAANAISVSKTATLLLLILLAGALGTLLTPQAQATRSAAGALPLVYALIALLTYSTFSIRASRIVNWMLAGGVILAIWVIALGLPSIGSQGDYYEEKLRVETFLGRSNYLAAFLIFLVGLSWPRNRWLALLFAFAVVCTMSRGGLAILALFVCALALAKRGKLWIVGSLSLLAMLSVIVFIFLFETEALAIFIDSSDERLDSTLNRLLIWNFGLELWVSQPFLGIGPNTFRTFVETANDIEDVWGVHNSILLMLLNYGIVGAALYAYYLREIYKALRQAELMDPRIRSVRAVFVSLLVFSLFEPLVGSGAFELLLALMLVLAKSTAGVKMSQPANKIPQPRRAHA